MGLWTSSGTLLASGFVGSGTSGLLQDDFRCVDITDVLLPIGDYVVGAFFGPGSADTQALDMTGISMASGLAYGQSRFINTASSLTMPTSTLGGRTGLLGGTLMVDSAATVPEPGSWALALSALAGLGLARRRRA